MASSAAILILIRKKNEGPGGVFIHAFSNRWFPPKVIRICPELHEFERMGLVLEYFLNSGHYTKLETYSIRGLPRPEYDTYDAQLAYSDPVYAVWGHKPQVSN